MVKRFEPFPVVGYDGFALAEMRESLNGEWVKLPTYIDETTRLNRQIERQNVAIKKLHAMIGESIHISQLYIMTTDDIQQKYYDWIKK